VLEKFKNLPLKIILVAGAVTAVFDILLYLSLPKVSSSQDSFNSNISAQDTLKQESPQNELRSGFNLLLIGYGGSGHSGGTLADALVVLNFNPNTKRVSRVS
jgi:anionic cell wall polymer biosynthesis LytR-Cps2A-Psr (LCP) family protein